MSSRRRSTRTSAAKATQIIRTAIRSEKDENEDQEAPVESDEADDGSGDEYKVEKGADGESSGNEDMDADEAEVRELRTPKGERKEASEKSARDGNTIQAIRKRILDHWHEYINVPDGLRQIPKGFETEQRNMLKKKPKVNCPLKCGLSFTTALGLSYHYKRCGISSSSSCKLCQFACSRGQFGLFEHMVSYHLSALPELTEEDLKAEVDYFLKPKEAKTPIRNLKERHIAQSEQELRYNFTFKRTIQEIIDLRAPLHNKKSFLPNDLPKADDWHPLSSEEARTYLPEQKPSVKFKLGQQSKWTQLPIFGSSSSADHATFYVGSHCRSATWCPQPDSELGQKQFLAIATCKNFDEAHSYCDNTAGASLLQIWSCDISHSVANATKTQIQFEFAIALDFRMAWDLAWCPMGNSWQKEKAKADSRTLQRLGLLAVAGSDGEILIHSVPWPDGVRKPDQSGPLVFRPPPKYLLEPPGVGPAIGDQATICRTVSWSPVDLNIITAGYGSGLVAIWQLSTESPLLIVEDAESQTVILRPLREWPAHATPVNSVQCCPVKELGNYLATSGFNDNTIKIWDLDDLQTQLITIDKASTLSMSWSALWPGIFAGYDDGYTGLSTPVYFRDFLNGSTKQVLSSHKSSVWSVDFSDWSSSEASVDAAGEATVFHNFFFGCKKRDRKGNVSKFPLYHIKLQNLDGKDKVKKEENEVYYSHKQITDVKGLVFVDYSLTDFNKFPPQEIKRVRSSDMMNSEHPSNYPLNSLNKIAWNPNRQAYNWILTCGQAGLCRISFFKAIDIAEK